MTKLHFTSVPDLQAHQVVGLLELAQAEVQKSSGMNPKVVTWICEFADFFFVFWIGHIYIYIQKMTWKIAMNHMLIDSTRMTYMLMITRFCY